VLAGRAFCRKFVTDGRTHDVGCITTPSDHRGAPVMTYCQLKPSKGLCQVSAGQGMLRYMRSRSARLDVRSTAKGKHGFAFTALDC
jgi:hypothetical protein